MTKHPTYQKKGPAKKQTKNVQGTSPSRALCHEENHADEETIYSQKFPFRELIPNWDIMDPNTKNPAFENGGKFARGHHGPNNKAKKKKDFEDFDVALCLEWIWLEEHKVWVRCQNEFTTESKQCTTHSLPSHKDGPNRIYKLMKDNKVGNWGMLKNKHLLGDTGESLSPEEQYNRDKKELKAIMEQAVNAGCDYMTEETKRQEALSRLDAQLEIQKKEFRNIISFAAGTNDPPKSEYLQTLDKKASRNPNQHGKTKLDAVSKFFMRK
jgi:hypothetical protein